MWTLIENERRTKEQPHPYVEERRKPVNIVNEANRLALAGECTCGGDDPLNYCPIERDTAFARAALICEAAFLLDELTSDLFTTPARLLMQVNADPVEVKQLIEQLHDIAEELAGSRVLELYGPKVES